MSKDPRDIWFPAKRYGWGWGFPIAWQGWVVLLIYIALLSLGCLEYVQTRDALFFYVFLAIITAGLIAICWYKGETPRWRWGGR